MLIFTEGVSTYLVRHPSLQGGMSRRDAVPKLPSLLPDRSHFQQRWQKKPRPAAKRTGRHSNPYQGRPGATLDPVRTADPRDTSAMACSRTSLSAPANYRTALFQASFKRELVVAMPGCVYCALYLRGYSTGSGRSKLSYGKNRTLECS